MLAQARARGVQARALLIQTCLHLPRVADERGRVGRSGAAVEVEAQAARIEERISGYRDLLAPPRPPLSRPDELRVEECDETLARIVLERFHYIAAHRPGSRHYAAYAPDGRPAALVSVSDANGGAPPLRVGSAELASLAPQLISRSFVFDWAPRNTMSWMLKAVARDVSSREQGSQLLITRVDVNLGFSAASYRASNWQELGSEQVPAYTYVRGRFVTSTELGRRYGTASTAALRSRLGSDFEVSRMPLAPMLVYGFGLTRGMRQELSRGGGRSSGARSQQDRAVTSHMS